MSGENAEVFFDESSYSSFDEVEEIKRELFSENADGMYESLDDVSDEEAWDVLSQYKEDDWEETIRRINKAADRAQAAGIIVIGTLGLWDGTARGGFIAEDVDTAINNILSGCEPYKVYMEDGELHIESMHHDGYNDWTLRALSDDGLKYSNYWEGYYADIETGDLIEEDQMHLNIFERDDLSSSLELEWD